MLEDGTARSWIGFTGQDRTEQNRMMVAVIFVMAELNNLPCLKGKKEEVKTICVLPRKQEGRFERKALFSKEGSTVRKFIR